MPISFPRASGILLHPTSLPGGFGIGDLGDEAYRFVDLLVRSRQTYWQILPLGPVGQGNSPYSAYSAFAGNTLLISPEKLVDDDLLLPLVLKGISKFSANKVDFDNVGAWKKKVLARAFETFQAESNSRLREGFDYFCHVNTWWLDDYALFCAVKSLYNNDPWFEWATTLKLRDRSAVNDAATELSREVAAEKFYQFLFFRQWLALRKYANDNGVRIIGDIPIFVAHDSADVWCNQDKFKLNDDGSPKFVAGVPPDYFSKTGQRWGNPIYDWEAMQADRFNWWTARMAFTLETVDIVRLDHFIGFSRNWEVPGTDETAQNGKWNDVPGNALFAVLRERLGELPVIAEDLGSMTPEVEHLRDTFGFPGMRILQYAFGGDARNRDLPHNYINNSVAYTGTHDNDTIAGWYRSAPKNVRTHCCKYIRSNGRDIHWGMIGELFASVADTVIVPAQDVLGLGSDSRMNTPATGSGNWEWRMTEGSISEKVTARLAELTEFYGRTN